MIKSGLNNDVLGSTSWTGDGFHTVRVDVLGDNIDLWLDLDQA